MGDRWIEALRPVCKRACVEADFRHPTQVVLFYLARWCQKKAKRAEPEIGEIGQAALREAADRIIQNLAEDGERVERLAEGDGAELSKLKRLLLASARPRAGEAAEDYAEEALQRISIVLLTGTPPSRAAEELRRGPDGPRNEYVFQSPFEPWARRVVINLVIDERRRARRQREGAVPAAPAQQSPPLDKSTLEGARNALPGLVRAIRALPEAQRLAMVLSLSRPDVDEPVREHLHELDPDLFPAPGDDQELFSSDDEIAECLSSTSRRVAANRSLARRRLAERDSAWELVLDQLLPHRSTRPVHGRKAVATSRGKEDRED